MSNGSIASGSFGHGVINIPAGGTCMQGVKTMINNRIFQSYWQAGYEGADHVNNAGLPLSMNNSTQHANLAYDDYLLLGDFEIGTVRESVGWRTVEKDARRLFINRTARVPHRRLDHIRLPARFSNSNLT